jgi:hypothetical protein
MFLQIMQLRPIFVTLSLSTLGPNSFSASGTPSINTLLAVLRKKIHTHIKTT